MKKTIAAVLLATLLGGAGGYAWVAYQNRALEAGLLSRLVTLEEQLSTTKNELLGHTTYTDYLSVTKQALSAQMKFLAARVNREYVQVQHIERSVLKVPFDATVTVTYAVEYSFGYDLKPESFSVSGSGTGTGIVVNLRKPELVAAPAVKIISHRIPGSAPFIDEKTAVIALQQQLHDIALKNAKAIQKDEAVIALCEKKLGEFLRDFLAKQPNVKVIPAISFVYT